MDQRIKDLSEATRLFSLVITDVCEANCLRQVAGDKLNRSQMTILKILHIAGTKTISEIASALQFSRPAASKSIDRLVKTGYITRIQDSSDRRSQNISITPDGQKIITEYDSLIHERQGKSISAFSPEEQDTLLRLLRKYLQYCIENQENVELICLQCDGKLHEHCSLDDPEGICHFQIQVTEKSL